MKKAHMIQGEDGQRKRPGPIPGPPMDTYTMKIEPVDAEWAKREAGGMAALVRRLLREARLKAEGKNE